MTAIFGVSGYIGSFLFDKTRYFPVGHGQHLSLPSTPIPESIQNIIWCAGWPGNKNVDDVEKNPIRSELQNVWEPLELAQRCSSHGKRLLVLCSGCIYDKLNSAGLPHKEDDIPNFIGTVYLRHQAQRGERLVRDFSNIATIFRIRVPFDGSHHKRNTLHKLAEMKSVWDSDQSYTWLPDLKRAVMDWEEGIIDGGIWHITQPGIMNNYDAVKRFLNPSVGRITGGDRPDPSMACARSSAILDSSKIQRVISMTPIGEAWEKSCFEYRLTKLNPLG